MGLCEVLLDLASGAQAGLTHQCSCVFGPIPLTLNAGSADTNKIIFESLLGSTTPCWSPLQLSILNGEELQANRLPLAARPLDDQLVVVRSEGLIALSSGPEQTMWLLQPDHGAATFWFWARDLDALPPWERFSPLRAAARWWAVLHGGAMVHAGAVGDGERSVLLVGASGVGKSTSTMACLGSGLQVLGDDYCLLQAPGASTSSPIAFGMYRHAKLSEHSLSLLPTLRQRMIGSGWNGKRLVDLGITRVPPHAVAAVCEVVQDPTTPTRYEPLSRMQALRALAPSTLFQQRLWERETWQALTTTIRSVPCFRLLVNDPQAVPDQVRQLLAATTS
jgi:hypothetical protein